MPSRAEIEDDDLHSRGFSEVSLHVETEGGGVQSRCLVALEGLKKQSMSSYKCSCINATIIASVSCSSYTILKQRLAKVLV